MNVTDKKFFFPFSLKVSFSNFITVGSFPDRHVNQISGTCESNLVACQLNSSSDLNCTIRGGTDDVVAVWSEGGFVHEGGVAAELLQSFARFKPVDSETKNFIWMNLMNAKQRKVNRVDSAVLVFT